MSNIQNTRVALTRKQNERLMSAITVQTANITMLIANAYIFVNTIMCSMKRRIIIKVLNIYLYSTMDLSLAQNVGIFITFLPWIVTLPYIALTFGFSIIWLSLWYQEEVNYLLLGQLATRTKILIKQNILLSEERYMLLLSPNMEIT